MGISHNEKHSIRRQEIGRSLLIRIINETIERIRKDTALIVLPSREETVAAALTNLLEQAGLIPENDESDAMLDEERNTNSPDTDLPPLNDAEIKTALDTIPDLSVVEKVVFADDLHWLGRKEQEEFFFLLKNHK